MNNIKYLTFKRYPKYIKVKFVIFFRNICKQMANIIVSGVKADTVKI